MKIRFIFMGWFVIFLFIVPSFVQAAVDYTEQDYQALVLAGRSSLIQAADQSL